MPFDADKACQRPFVGGAVDTIASLAQDPSPELLVRICQAAELAQGYEAALDVLTYRTFALRAPQRLTWRQVYRQLGADPARAKDHRTVQKFRVKVLRELKKIFAGLAGPELLDGQRGLDPLALNPVIAPSDHRQLAR